jgi:hypothetical protein
MDDFITAERFKIDKRIDSAGGEKNGRTGKLNG